MLTHIIQRMSPNSNFILYYYADHKQGQQLYGYGTETHKQRILYNKLII